jgi:hypothetical protein
MTKKRLDDESRRRTWFYICTGDRVPPNKYRLVRVKRKVCKNELVTVHDIEGKCDEEKKR